MYNTIHKVYDSQHHANLERNLYFLFNEINTLVGLITWLLYFPYVSVQASFRTLWKPYRCDKVLWAVHDRKDIYDRLIFLKQGTLKRKFWIVYFFIIVNKYNSISLFVCVLRPFNSEVISLAKNIKPGKYTVPIGNRTVDRHVAVHYATMRHASSLNLIRLYDNWKIYHILC